MKILLGHDDYLLTQGRNVPIYYDLKTLINAHMLIMGKTGMGKTTFLCDFIQQMSLINNPPQIHVIDVHGDIDIKNASSVRFSESTNYGLNPFIVSPDPHFGGVRKRIQDFISTINNCRPIGSRQETVMRHLITDLYAANGFFVDNHKSWSLEDGNLRKYAKKYPTIDDACRFAFGKLKQLIIGSDTQAGKALENLNKTTNKIFRNSKLLNKPDGENNADLMEKALNYREDAKKYFINYVESIETGKELEDLIKYESKEVLKSVVERFDSLKATGIFKNTPAPFDQNSFVWQYNITALREDEKRMFVEFRLQEIFTSAMEKGHVGNNDSNLLRDVIFLDEAHLFFSDDKDNILNTISKEGRKFGLGLICASQSPNHFSEDFFSNVATKVILGIDQMYWDNLVRKMKIEPKLLKYIKPFNVIGVQMSNKAETSSKFTMTNIKNKHLQLS